MTVVFNLESIDTSNIAICDHGEDDWYFSDI